MDRGGENRRVLIVEAEMATRIALRHLFERRGWRTSLAKTAAEAVALLGPHLDWIVLNPWLPGGDGTEVLRAVREAGFKARVALIPEDLDPESLPQLLELAPDLLMPKPIAFDRLFNLCSGAA